MRIRLSGAIVLLTAAVALPAVAQTAPIKTSVVKQSDGRVILTIRNLSPDSAITAYLYKTQELHGIGWGYRDAAIEARSQPVPPDQQITQDFGSGAQPVEVIFLAAVWKDGATFGDPTWVNRLIEHRNVIGEHLLKATLMVQTALNSDEDPQAVRRQFQQLADGIRREDYHPDDFGVVRQIYAWMEVHFANPPIRLSDNTRITDPHAILRSSLDEYLRRLGRFQLYR